MPTPRPIIAASWGAKSAVSKTCVSSVTMLSAMPRATTAVSTGSAIATTEPNMISRTMIAASRPMASVALLFDCCASRIASPPSSTSTPPAALALSRI